MTIRILSVGTIKEKYIIDAINEYTKRLSKYAKVIFTKVDDEPIPDKAKARDEEKIKITEGKKLLAHINPKDYNIALAIDGVMLSSEELASKFVNIFTYESSNITFIIGGSLGLSKEVLDACNYKLSFSKMTFPHGLFRIILLEQIYRSFKILNNESYHK